MTTRQRMICYLLLVLVLVPTQVILQSYTSPKTISYINFKRTQQQVRYTRNSIIGVSPPATGNWIVNETTYIENEVEKIIITGSVVISASFIILNSSIELSVSGKIYVKQDGLFEIIRSNVTVFAEEGIVVEGKMQLFQAIINFPTFSPRAYLGYSLLIYNKGTFEATHSTLNGPSEEPFQNPTRVLTKNATFKTALSFIVRNSKFDFMNATVELSKVTFTEPSYPITLKNVTNSKIENSFFLNEEDPAIIIKNSNNVSITNNLFENITGYTAIQIENSSNISLERNTIRNTWGYSLYLRNTYNVTILNNTLSNNRGGFWKVNRYGIHQQIIRFYGGVYLENTTDIRFLNIFTDVADRSSTNYDLLLLRNSSFVSETSTFIGITDYFGNKHIKIYANGTTFKARQSFVSKNIGFVFVNSSIDISDAIFGNLMDIMVIENCIDGQISNSQFVGGLQKGLEIKNSKNVKIVNNHFKDTNNSIAVNVWNSFNISIVANIIEGTKGRGLVIKDSKNIIVASNTFFGNRGGLWINGDSNYQEIIRPFGGVYLENTSDVLLFNNTLYGESITLGLINNFTSITLSNNLLNNAEIIYYYNRSSLEVSKSTIGEIILVNCTNFTFRNVATSTVEVLYSKNIMITNTTINNSTFGFILQNSENITFSQCNFSNVINNFMYKTTNTTFESVGIWNVSLYGMKIDESTENYIIGSEIKNTFYAIYVTNSTGVYIASSKFVSTSKEPIKIEDCKNITIFRNHFAYFGFYRVPKNPPSVFSAINITNPEGVIIIENNITGHYYLNQGVNIELGTHQSKEIIIKNNLIDGLDIGLSIAGSYYYPIKGHIYISDNKIISGALGIYIYGVSSIVVNHNFLHNYDCNIRAYRITNAIFENNTFSNTYRFIYVTIGLSLSRINDTLIANNSFFNSLLLFPDTEFSSRNITITATNTLNGYPIIQITNKDNITIANKILGELLINNCTNIVIENITAFVAFIWSTENITINSFNLTKALGPLQLGYVISAHLMNIYINGTVFIETLRKFRIGIYLIYGKSISVQDIFVEWSYVGLSATDVTSLMVENSTFTRNIFGIELYNTKDAIFRNNTISSNYIGIFLNIKIENSSETNSNESIVFFCNNISDNTEMHLNTSTTKVTFYFNNFIGNRQGFTVEGYVFFDNGKIGNYWSNYEGVDENKDGIGDTPYKVTGNYYDRYPLMSPCSLELYLEIIQKEKQTSDQDNDLTAAFVFVLTFVSVSVGWYIYKRLRKKTI